MIGFMDTTVLIPYFCQLTTNFIMISGPDLRDLIKLSRAGDQILQHVGNQPLNASFAIVTDRMSIRADLLFEFLLEIADPCYGIP